MAKTTAKPKTAGDKIKLGIIPVLAVTLFLVLRSPDQETGDSTAIAAGAAPVALVGSPAPGPSANSPARQPTVWPQLSLQQILDHNPFSLPEQLAPPKVIAPEDDPAGTRPVVTPEDDPQAHEPEPTPEEIEAALRQELLEKLEKTEMTAFYQSQRGTVAIVGDKVLHEGDVIDGAVKVVKIQPDRVIYRTLAP